MTYLVALAVAFAWAAALAWIAESVERSRWRCGTPVGGATSWRILFTWVAALFLISSAAPGYTQLSSSGQDTWDAAVLPMTLSTLWVGAYAGVREARRALLVGSRSWRSAARAALANTVIGLFLAVGVGAWPALLGLALSIVTVALFGSFQRALHDRRNPTLALPRGYPS